MPRWAAEFAKSFESRRYSLIRPTQTSQQRSQIFAPGNWMLMRQPLPVARPKRTNWKLSRVIYWIQRTLPPVVIEVLSKISLSIKQTNADHGHTQATGRLHLIPCNVA